MRSGSLQGGDKLVVVDPVPLWYWNEEDRKYKAKQNTRFVRELLGSAELYRANMHMECFCHNFA